MHRLSPLIFDLDGTLWDCTDTCLDVWNDVLKARRIDAVVTRQQFHSILGTRYDEISNVVFPGLTEPEKEEIMTEISAREVTAIRQNGGRLFPGLESTLRQLARERKLFIVSNCQKGYIEAFLHFYRLEVLFTDFECSGNTRKGKPHNIRLIIERNKLSQPVYIGDTEDDRKACEEVGIPFIHAVYGFGENVESLYKITNIQDLAYTDILERFD